MGVIRVEGALSSEIMNTITNYSFVDDTSDKIDQLTVSFDASRISSLPPHGTKYELFIHEQSRGSWSVISSAINLKNEMTLVLSTVEKQSSIKQRYTRQFTDKTILQVVTEVVAVAGYKADVCASFAGKKITTSQAMETAGEFLNRLAKEHDAVSKPYNGVWMFKRRLSTTTSKGNKKPTVMITDDTRCISGVINRSSDKTFKGVLVRYKDIESAEMVVVRLGDAPYNDRGIVSKLKAQEIAQSYTSENSSKAESITLTLPTDEPVIGSAFSEGVLSVNRGRFFKADYIIESVSINPKTTVIKGSLPK